MLGFLVFTPEPWDMVLRIRNFLERRDSAGATGNQNGSLSRPREKSDAWTEASSGQPITLVMTNALIYTVFSLEEFWVSQTMQNLSNNCNFLQLPSVIGHAFFSHTFTHIFTHKITLFFNRLFSLKEIWKMQCDSKCIYGKYTYLCKVSNKVLKCSMNCAAMSPNDLEEGTRKLSCGFVMVAFARTPKFTAPAWLDSLT